jgi:hypothetical protein
LLGAGASGQHTRQAIRGRKRAAASKSNHHLGLAVDGTSLAGGGRKTDGSVDSKEASTTAGNGADGVWGGGFDRTGKLVGKVGRQAGRQGRPKKTTTG